jgi:hypothetical protein
MPSTFSSYSNFNSSQSVKVFGFFKDEKFSLGGEKTDDTSSNTVSTYFGSEHKTDRREQSLSYGVCYCPIGEKQTTSAYTYETSRSTYTKTESSISAISTSELSITERHIYPLLIDTSSRSYLFYKSDSTNINYAVQERITTEIGKSSASSFSVDITSINSYIESFSAPGITINNNRLYLVTPSTKNSLLGKNLYGKQLWGNRAVKDYSSLSNIYDNTTPEKLLTNIPVWNLTFNQETKSIDAQKDTGAKMYPLIKGAVVLAASYYA